MDQVQVIPGPEAEIPGVSKLAVVGGSGTPTGEGAGNGHGRCTTFFGRDLTLSDA